MRAFAAVSVPDEIRSGYSKLCRPLRDAAEIGLVRPDRMHITLAFFNDLDKTVLPSAESALKAAFLKPITVKCAAPELFRRRGAPSVICVKAESDELSETAAKFRSNLESSGIDYDKKPFRAHITLGRIKEIHDTGLFERIYRNVSKRFEPSTFTAEFLYLFESDMVKYTEIFKTPPIYGSENVDG